MSLEKNNDDLAQAIAQALSTILQKQESVPESADNWYTDSSFFCLDKAKELALCAEKKAIQMGITVSIAIVDFSGNLVLFHRMPDTVTASVDYAHHKAYTAAIYQWPSHKMDDLIQPASAMTALLNIDPKVTSLGGGLPIQVKGKMMGGLGISGGALDQDIQIARHVLECCCKK